MNWPTAFTYCWMIVAWVFGIAAAIKLSVMWAVLATLFPPAAWVILAAHVLRTL